MKYAKIAARDGRQADHLPYLRHVHDRVIKTKQGFYLGVIRLNGLCFQTPRRCVRFAGATSQ